MHGDGLLSVWEAEEERLVEDERLDGESGDVTLVSAGRMKRSVKRVADVRVGDRVVTVLCGQCGVATVEACVRQRVRGPWQAGVRMSAIGAAIVTAGHPVRVQDRWQRAGDLVAQWQEHGGELECRELVMDIAETYNFSLNTRSSLIVNGLEVCTLGQFCDGIDDGDSFFGSEAVVNELKGRIDYPNVTLTRYCTGRR